MAGSAGLYHPGSDHRDFRILQLTTMSGTNSAFPIDLKQLKPYAISPSVTLPSSRG
jgi:hypothetical protein